MKCRVLTPPASEHAEPNDHGRSSQRSLCHPSGGGGFSIELTERAGERWHQEPLGLGARLGRYELLEVLGAGGMGVVFEAHDPKHDRRVAIKILRPGAGAFVRASAARLWQEGITMSRLRHPNITRLYEVGVADEQVFVAMELVRGRTLGAWVSHVPRTLEEVIAVFVQAGRGLASIHDAGLVHCDFKPQNVLVGDDGRVLITDFGLAVALNAKRNGPCELVGTPAYMAPEQRAADQVDPRTDQYSFCIALWRALAALPETAARSFESLPATRIHATTSRVPHWLAAVLMRGLEAEPDLRFQTMHELIALLESGVERGLRLLRVLSIA